MANAQNLKPWAPGKSGNPAGKPRGTKHLSTWIRDILEDDTFIVKLDSGLVFKGAPLEAIIHSLVLKAVNGDMKAFDLLAKYGYGTKLDLTSKDQPLAFNFASGTSKYVRQVDDLTTPKQ